MQKVADDNAEALNEEIAERNASEMYLMIITTVLCFVVLMGIAVTASAKMVDRLGERSKKIGEITQVTESINAMADATNDIASEMNDINSYSGKVASEMQAVSAATEEQSASAEEIAAASEALAKLAQDQQEALSKFRF